MGGFPTGWTGYARLQTQATVGMDSYLVGFAVIGIGMITAGFNLAATIINFRAPGMTWGRVPIFVWSILATAALLVLATPTLVVAGLFGVLDRTAQTAFYVNEHGGSSFLWQNLFWFFGHPEVYIMALPGFGIVGEILPVFTRKPLFAYRVGAAGMIGVALLSFFVWQHHLFQSGINPDMRPLFMLTTELISIPTGFIFLVGLGTLWKAKIRFEVPMLFAMGMYFNFLIGGVTGVFLSDVPVNVTVHGSFFVMAHFHYTIMGGLVFAFFGGSLLLAAEDDRQDDEQASSAQWHFWTMFIFFNLTFFPLFLVGLLGQPRRVFEYASNLQTLNDISSVGAFLLGASFLIFIANFVWSIFIDPKLASANPWDSLGLEWQTATPVPPHNFDRIPVVLDRPVPLQRGWRSACCRPRLRFDRDGRRERARRRRRLPELPILNQGDCPHERRCDAGGQTERRRVDAAAAVARGDRVRAAIGRGCHLDWRAPPDRHRCLCLRIAWRSRISTYVRSTATSSGDPAASRLPIGAGTAIFVIAVLAAALNAFGIFRLRKGHLGGLGGRWVDGSDRRARRRWAADLAARRTCPSSRARAGMPPVSSVGR